MTTPPDIEARPTIEAVTELAGTDLEDLCEASEAAIEAGGGFGWVRVPPRHILEKYWQGVLLVPERQLFVARLDGVIAGSAQLTRPPRNNEAQAHMATLTGAFVAPWARRHGLGRMLLSTVAEAARSAGFLALALDVRETQTAAIALCESLGFRRWGVNPDYARVDGRAVAGYYYTKSLTEDGSDPE